MNRALSQESFEGQSWEINGSRLLKQPQGPGDGTRGFAGEGGRASAFTHVDLNKGRVCL